MSQPIYCDRDRCREPAAGEVTVELTDGRQGIEVRLRLCEGDLERYERVAAPGKARRWNASRPSRTGYEDVVVVGRLALAGEHEKTLCLSCPVPAHTTDEVRLRRIDIRKGYALNRCESCGKPLAEGLDFEIRRARDELDVLEEEVQSLRGRLNRVTEAGWMADDALNALRMAENAISEARGCLRDEGDVPLVEGA